jgi:hypothetical protein
MVAIGDGAFPASDKDNHIEKSHRDNHIEKSHKENGLTAQISLTLMV